LSQIHMPMAKPSIMAGINKMIKLSRSMVVNDSMVGAPGLCKPIIQAHQRIDVGLGFEAGLAVVILAIILDRLTAILGAGRRKATKDAAPRSSTDATSAENAESATEDTPVASSMDNAQPPIARVTASGGKETV